MVNYFYRLGEICSHIAAIRFKVEACARLGFNKVACTSVPCGWNQNHTKKVLIRKILASLSPVCKVRCSSTVCGYQNLFRSTCMYM